jgi:hypothetical protein
MVITDKIQLRQLSNRKWIRPELGLRKLQTLKFFSQLLPQTGGSRSWRGRPFTKYSEEFQAALFSYGLQQHTPACRWEYSYGEFPPNREFDCLVRCQPLLRAWKPVQLKELVPEDLPGKRNERDSLQAMIENVAAKYTAPQGQEMLVVAIFVNRATTIGFQELRIPKMCVEQLWFYGFTNAVNCFIVGNLLGNPARRDFAYPHFKIEPPVSAASHDE